jgi:hypothetical protein
MYRLAVGVVRRTFEEDGADAVGYPPFTWLSMIAGLMSAPQSPATR